MPSSSCLRIYTVFLLIFLPTTRGCAQTRELQTTNCVCVEENNYSNISCPLSDDKSIGIIMTKDLKYEINCHGHQIEDLDKIVTLFQERRDIIAYYGFNNCPMIKFKEITQKLFQNTMNFKMLELKNLNEIISFELQGFEITTLSIENCTIDHLPEELLFSQSNLERLQIVDNKYLTTLPENFFQKSLNLQVINLGSNNLINLPNKLFSNLNKLSYLLLFANNIKTIEPELLQNLYNLEVLELMTNKLENIPKNAFKNLTNLTKLSLRNNFFKTLPEGLFKYNLKLESIDISNNPNFTTIPDYLFANMSNLKTISIKQCNLNKLPENLFSGTINLQTLQLSKNKLKHLPKNLFKDTEKLKTLELDQNILEKIDDYIFNNTTMLDSLNLGYNALIITDFTFYGLWNLNSLKLNHNSISNLTAKSMSYFKKLERLDLSFNYLTLEKHIFKDVYSILPHLDKLRDLNLQSNEISLIFSDWMFSTPKLENINLANNKLTSLNYNDLQFLQNHKLTINLEDNLISTINLTSAELLLKENSNLPKREIKLKGNPIFCDCRIYDFVRFVNKNMDPKVYFTLSLKTDYDEENYSLQCQSPDKYKGQRIKDLNSKYLTCTLDNGPKLPANCYMQHYEYRYYGKRLILNCSNNELTELPKIEINHSMIASEFHFQEIEVLLSGNKITKMPTSGMGYENVVELDLSHNMINEITWVPPNIQVLKLNHNNLTYLDNSELSLINHTSIKNLTFHNNPWQCNCELINFTKYLQENFQKIPYLHNITCANIKNHIELTSLKPEDLCPYSLYLVVIICVILTFFGICTSLLIGMYYRFNTQIKVWLYAHNMCLYLITEEEIDQDKIYDAFISFSHEDENFVVNELLPGLEDGPSPYKLCVHFRDWQPGEFITTNIARSIDASRRTVVVVSKGFLRSEWGKMEFRTAHTEALKEGRARVIVIVYGDIGPLDDLEPEIKAYLSTNTYVKWGTKWFWDSLRYALPHSSKYAKLNEVITNAPSSKISPLSPIKEPFHEKTDLIHEPSTPPAASTPPADSIHRVHEPLLITPTALNVSLINGTLINNYPEKVKSIDC